MPRESLARRIVTAYVLFSLGGSLLFGIAAAFIVEGIEVRLVDERLKSVAAWASPRHAANMPVAMPTGLSFYQGATIPGALRRLPSGVHEIEVEGARLQVFAGQNAAGPFVVTDHDSDYEQVEFAVYSLLALGFIAFVGMSLLLGRFMARRFVSPIKMLSDAVAERRGELPLTERDDELGVLARAFAQYSADMQRFLDRERFFTGDVSHELRTPLTIISGAAELLLMEGKAGPKVLEPSHRIQRAAQDAAETVDILLQLARAPELIDMGAVSMASVVADEVARCHTLVAGRPLSLVNAGGEDFLVRSPTRLLGAAVGNLLRNACQYTEQGVVQISLERNCVLIQDSGHGVPQELRAMLADGAMRVPGSAGAGLGLALVKRICDYLGADLEISDMAAGGSCVRIRFTAA